jgi:hypothetical protein
LLTALEHAAAVILIDVVVIATFLVIADAKRVIESTKAAESLCFSSRIRRASEEPYLGKGWMVLT